MLPGMPRFQWLSFSIFLDTHRNSALEESDDHIVWRKILEKCQDVVDIPFRSKGLSRSGEEVNGKQKQNLSRRQEIRSPKLMERCQAATKGETPENIESPGSGLFCQVTESFSVSSRFKWPSLQQKA